MEKFWVVRTISNTPQNCHYLRKARKLYSHFITKLKFYNHIRENVNSYVIRRSLLIGSGKEPLILGRQKHCSWKERFFVVTVHEYWVRENRLLQIIEEDLQSASNMSFRTSLVNGDFVNSNNSQQSHEITLFLDLNNFGMDLYWIKTGCKIEKY